MMNLTGDWQEYLADEFEKDYMLALLKFLQTEKQNKTLYPAETEYFTALNVTPFSKLKVVILGQDPYHGEGQAHGLSFSVKPGIKVPPSLVNIYKELEMDLGITPAQHGFLLQWAEQGVLLLNSVLTVEASKAGSHQNKGWEIFTDKIIELINNKHQGVVFMLWGSYAQKKGRHIDRDKHCVLESVHPSPLSAYRGFLGCQHFSKANNYLVGLGKEPIKWALEPIESTNKVDCNTQIGLPF
ncbi:uracil-DNA glycosylase [Marinomonas sp. A3A]|jgi:uracil-DNA glycosylase|uniref:uracil-DNA glycosylase n=1 Tax=Marinomonas sp. A3A TaxID=2065312 RepID=UPI001BB3BF35|nr:uracil-DNA glycosylase [Marinomonas sp. A3A]QUX90890.1 uracil-DNA glycosylase [Marinomonas sp. A3A]